MWRVVSWKWKNVIDNFPSLWSSINIIDRTEHVKIQLEKSKGVPVDIQILSPSVPDGDWTQLLVDNASRWRSLVIDGYPLEFAAQLGPSPLNLVSLNIHLTDIPHDCSLFSLIRPNLRKLELTALVIPHTFDPTLGLEELQLYNVYERLEDGSTDRLSVTKFHQFLQTNPNLRVLELNEIAQASPNDSVPQQVSLPRLEEFTSYTSRVLNLFRAEHCVDLRIYECLVKEPPPLSTWATSVHAIRRVEQLTITVADSYLSLQGAGGPYHVELCVATTEVGYEDEGDVIYSVLNDILDEAEKDTHISARVELALFVIGRKSAFDVALSVLKLLQTPFSDFSLGKSRWRTPNLDTITMLAPGLPYHHLRAFIQARSNGSTCIQPSSPITGIFTRSDDVDGLDREDVFNQVMAYTGGGNDV
ncbi:hypothetical protein FRC01_010962 [Tulasnella sp. 417]|nr:hypothetical protein FRC01_010962 [Tulasnella sp. 417]